MSFFAGKCGLWIPDDQVMTRIIETGQTQNQPGPNPLNHWNWILSFFNNQNAIYWTIKIGLDWTPLNREFLQLKLIAITPIISKLHQIIMS